MPQLNLRPDTLDQENRRFRQQPLAQPLFLNSVPKAGTHLLRNILRMFVPAAQQYQREFIQWANMAQHRDAWHPAMNMFSWGHLLFSDASVIELGHVRKLLLIRDPYDWVLARARFFVSDQFDGNVDYLRDGRLKVDDLLSLMIFGIYQKAPSLNEIYSHNAVAWLASSDLVVRYEDLRHHCRRLDTAEAEDYFRALFDACGIAMPDDWRERVRVGADPAQSGTARQNLTGIAADIPDTLPELHRRMVDYEAPGLRRILGYEDPM